VAIASLPGAGGEELGHRLAERLGHGCFGREIVDEIAARQGVPHELMQKLDERVRNAVDRFFADGVQDHRFTESEYMKEVERFVVPIARRGSAVFVGRGSAFLLGPELAFRLLVVAPFELRVARWARERRLTAEEAAASLRLEDEKRFDFVRHHFGVRLDDPCVFDLAVNTGTLGLDAAVDAAGHTYRRRAGP
jgi:cytidylate kinase